MREGVGRGGSGIGGGGIRGAGSVCRWGSGLREGGLGGGFLGRRSRGFAGRMVMRRGLRRWRGRRGMCGWRSVVFEAVRVEKEVELREWLWLWLFERVRGLMLDGLGGCDTVRRCARRLWWLKLRACLKK